MAKERHCYKIEVFTPYHDEEEVFFYSCCDRKALHEFANERLDEVAWQSAQAHYWEHSSMYNDEFDFYEDYAKKCGTRIFEISVAEYKKVERAIWNMT